MNGQSKSNNKLIKFYKGVCIQQIYDYMRSEGKAMSKRNIDKEIKINAGFPYSSCADVRTTIEDLQNLIVHAFVYGDAIGVTVDYPADELDKEIILNF